MSHESHHGTEHGCSCCSGGLRAALAAAVSRRDFMLGMGTAAAAGSLAAAQRAVAAGNAAPSARPTIAPASELVVQPVLTYAIPQRREQTSWRPWGGIQTPAQAAEEVKRIEKELAAMLASNGLAIRLLPLAQVQSAKEAAAVKQTACDAMLIYASGGGRDVLEGLVSPERANLFFLRHDTGPVSLWYEIMHPHMLRKASDEYRQSGVDVQDVVVDSYPGLAWRLRALLALRQTLGQRIVAVGGAGGWGDGHRLAPPFAREKWQLDIREVSYPEVGKRIESKRKDGAAVAKAKSDADAYLKQPGIKLQTDKKYVENAFLLCEVFKDLMKEHSCRMMTIQHCMGTIMPMSETTACLPLSLLNDSDHVAFCESDFVVIPAGILMHHILGTPVFLNDPTWPHNGVVTIAHCTAPRKMDGKTYEPATILTHFESDYGAAPKVEMRVGQVMTNVIPDFASKKWVGFKGKVVANPFLDICRSQTDVSVDGNCDRLVEDMRGFHWMSAYGDCLKEVAYAIGRLGIEFENISA
jgi:hypothetical protein